MSEHRSLTALARRELEAHLRPGDLAVDATVGNGHDTLTLARATMPGGRVIGLDIQADALSAAQGHLEAAALTASVTLLQQGHEQLREAVPADWARRISAVVFNLGYLPGSDKQVTTRSATTLLALDQAETLLRPGGLLSVVAYRGHPGGLVEANAVAQWMTARAVPDRLTVHESAGPVLYLWRR